MNLCKVLWVQTYHLKFHRILRLNRNRHLSHIPNWMMSINPWIRFNSIWSILAIIANKRTHLWPLRALKYINCLAQYTTICPQPHPQQQKFISIPSIAKLSSITKITVQIYTQHTYIQWTNHLNIIINTHIPFVTKCKSSWS